MELVKKQENYRSSNAVINLLNNFRTNIKQIPQKNIDGSIKFIYCNNYPCQQPKEKVTDYEKRIEPQKNINYEKIIIQLENSGWNFKTNSQDKILRLVNSRIAAECGFGNLYKVFSKRYGQRTKDKLLDRDHPLIIFFVGYSDKKISQEREIGIEHLLLFWQNKNYNEVFRFLKKYSSIFDEKFIEHKHKQIISKVLHELKGIRMNQSKSIGDVFNFIEKKVRKTERLVNFIDKTKVDLSTIADIEEKEKDKLEKDKILYDEFMRLPYQEIINFFEYIQDHTVLSTKHGTKGAEYKNVLTVIDDTEWKQQYNFEKFFENSDRILRTRNLFYVECSRAKENLVVLALSKMNEQALNNIKSWFGRENVFDIEASIE